MVIKVHFQMDNSRAHSFGKIGRCVYVFVLCHISLYELSSERYILVINLYN